jgi:hypothetical protein
MQQRQQHEGSVRNPASISGAESRFVKPVTPGQAKVQESPYFERRNKRLNSTASRSGALDASAEGKTYDALNGFLRNQIEMTSKNGDNKKKARTSARNNAVI